MQLSPKTQEAVSKLLEKLDKQQPKPKQLSSKPRKKKAKEIGYFFKVIDGVVHKVKQFDSIYQSNSQVKVPSRISRVKG